MPLTLEGARRMVEVTALGDLRRTFEDIESGDIVVTHGRGEDEQFLHDYMLGGFEPEPELPPKRNGRRILVK